MRQLGTLSTEQQAQVLVDYLLTQGIEGSLEATERACEVWIRDEDALPRAREIFAEFQADPNASQFTGATAQAHEIRRTEAKRREQVAKNFVRPGEKWTQSPYGGPKPVTTTLLVISIVVFLLTEFGSPQPTESGQASIGQQVFHRLTFLGLPDYVASILKPSGEDVSRASLYSLPTGSLQGVAKQSPDIDTLAARTYSLRHGEIWRLFTPCVLHFGWMHIVFNMWMFFSLGGILESQVGSRRYLAFILASGALSNFFQGIVPLDFLHDVPGLEFLRLEGSLTFGGMSGVLYGLFGWILMRQSFGRSQGLFIPSFSVILLIAWLVLGIVGFLPGIANWAHLIGFLVGLAVGYAPQLQGRR